MIKIIIFIFLIRSNHGRWQRGGNASNNCTILSNLNENVEYLGTFSKSEMFKFVIKDLIDRGIKIDNCVYYENCEAPLSSVVLSESSGSRTIVHSNPNLPYLVFNDFDKINLKYYKWIHFEARNVNDTKKMIEKAKEFNKENERDVKLSLDLEKAKLDNLELACLVDYIFLGRDFAEALNCNDKKSAVYALREKIKVK